MSQLREEIFKKKNDIDVLLIGDSAFSSTIDAELLERSLSAQVDHNISVVVAEGSREGIDRDYYVLRDFLQHRSIKLVILSGNWNKAKWRPDPTLGYIGDTMEILSDKAMPKRDRLHVLTQAWSHGLRKWTNFFGFGVIWEDSHALKGSVGKETYEVNSNSPQSFAVEPWIFRWDENPNFVLSKDIYDHARTYFFDKIRLLAKSRAAGLVILHTPNICDATDVIRIPHYDSAIQLSKIPVVGVPSSVLFPPSVETVGLFKDCIHANQAGARYYTSAIAPVIGELYREFPSFQKRSLNREVSFPKVYPLVKALHFTNRSERPLKVRMVLGEKDLFTRTLDQIFGVKKLSDREKALFLWSWVAEQVSNFDPPSGGNDFHNPYLLTHGFGYGYCDDMASVLAQLARFNGLSSRVLGIDGHVITEIFFDGKWNVLDPDHRLFFERDKKMLSMDEIIHTGFRESEIQALPSAERPLRIKFWASRKKYVESETYLEKSSWTEFTVLLPGARFEIVDLSEAPIDFEGDYKTPKKLRLKMAKISSHFDGSVYHGIVAFPTLRVTAEIYNSSNSSNSCSLSVAGKTYELNVAPGARGVLDSGPSAPTSIRELSGTYEIKCQRKANMNLVSLHQMSPKFAVGSFSVFASGQGLSF